MNRGIASALKRTLLFPEHENDILLNPVQLVGESVWGKRERIIYTYEQCSTGHSCSVATDYLLCSDAGTCYSVYRSCFHLPDHVFSALRRGNELHDLLPFYIQFSSEVNASRSKPFPY